LEELKEIQAYGWPLAPVDFFGSKEINWMGLIAKPTKELTESNYDILPVSSKQNLVFFVFEGECIVWNGQIVKSAKGEEKIKGEERIKWKDERWDLVMPKEGLPKNDFTKWDRVFPPFLRFPFPKMGQFVVFADTRQFYFVNMKGELHFFDPAAKEKKAKLLWGQTQPIVALITDAEKNKTYAFTKTEPRQKDKISDVYFEMSKELRPISYERKFLKGIESEDPMKKIMGYSKFLMTKKKIVLKTDCGEN